MKSVRADAIAKNLIPADFTMLEDCVYRSDFVVESSKEDIEVKKEIAARGEKVFPSHIVSGTVS